MRELEEVGSSYFVHSKQNTIQNLAKQPKRVFYCLRTTFFSDVKALGFYF